MLAALLVAGAVQAALTPLSDRELTRLLDGVMLQEADPDLVIVEGARFFFPNGRYVAQGRATSHGSWTVSSTGRLCHRLDGEHSVEGCISVATDGRGRFYAARTSAALMEGSGYEIRFVPVLTLR